MKILIVTQCFWPDIYMVNDIVATLVQRGHEVTVLTGLPDYTTSKIPKEYKFGRNRRQTYKGAKVIRCPIIARHHGMLFRCFNYLSFVTTGWCYASFYPWEDFDVIYVWQVTPVTMAVPAIRLKKRYKKPLFLYCLDLWPESLVGAGLPEKSLLVRAVHWWSNRIYRQCDHIAVSSKPFFTYLEQVNGYPRSKMSYLPQFTSSTFLNEDLLKTPNGQIDFLFVGNIGVGTDMPVILQACAILQQQKVPMQFHVHIVGHGSEYENSVQMAKDLKLDEVVTFYGAVSIEKTPQYYRQADACLLTLKGHSQTSKTLPGKLQSYMAAGKPILAAINGAGQEVIEESGCGACVAAGDPQGLSKLMLDFLNEPERYAVCGEHAKKYFEKEFTKLKHFETLEEQLLKLTGGGNPWKDLIWSVKAAIWPYERLAA